MYKVLTLLMISIITLHADFFKSAEKAEQKYQEERTHLCQVYSRKAIDYEKTMREDELAQITLESYKKRAKIFCSKEEAKKVQKTEDKVVEKPKYVKDISKEDERLCSMFLTKIKNYKQSMREDELASITLESYQKRAEIFCSKETLEKREKKVREEDTRLCKIFQQGPILTKKFDEKHKDLNNDPLSKETLKSFRKREEIFCSSQPLKKKDLEVYKEHQRLCKVFNNKIIAYEHSMRSDTLAYATLASYKTRASYFCATKKPNQKAEKR